MQVLAPTTKPSKLKKSSVETRPSVEACAQQILAHLPVVMWFIRKNMRFARGKGLSVSQFRTLARAERKGTLSDVANCLGTSLPTASRIVSGLVSRGYLKRNESADDRRRCHLTLTASGQKILKECYAVTQEKLEAELQQLTDIDCAEIAESMTILGRVFDESPTGRAS